MNPDRRLSEMHERIVIKRHNELNRLEDWLSGKDNPTTVWSLSGIGGIGKTTFLGQMEELARKAGTPVVRIDCYLGFANASEFLGYLCEQLGLSESGEMRSMSEAANLLLRCLYEQRIILLFDHFEELVSLESFIRTQLIPRLPMNGVLLVFATRAGLSIGWRTDPALLTRTVEVTLNNLTWQQSVEYVKKAGIHETDLQQRIIHETSGYPLALALAVQSALQESNKDNDHHPFIAHAISAALIREAAPQLNTLIEALIFLRTATQDVLSQVTRTAVSTEDFRALGSLSFVRVTGKGLAVHDVARAYLLSELKVRDPQRFDELFHRAVYVLGRLIEGASGSKVYDLSHNMVTLCMYAKPVFSFPNGSIPLQVSARELPKCEPLMESDVARLHGLIDIGIVGGTAVRTVQDHHDMLDLLIRQFPESVRVIRHDDGQPAAFTTLLPLYKESVSVLSGSTVDALRERLGLELLQYEQVSLVETDTMLSLITCVPIESQQFTFFDLLLAIKLTGWTELAEGKRCLLFSTAPELKEFHLQLRYGYLKPLGTAAQSVDIFSLDFRSQSMGKWLAALLSGTKTVPLQQGENITVTTDSLRDVLKHLQNPDMLKQSELGRALNIPAIDLQRMLLAAITEETPPKPLTAWLQNILRVSYLQGRTSIVAATQALNIGRTTYYRHLEKALSALLEVIAK